MKRCLLVSYVIASLLPLSVHAQKHSDSGQPPISVGVFGDVLGLQDVNAPGDSLFNNAILTLGLYAELPRLPLRPGLDLRCLCGDNGVQGMLTGPRISASLGPFRPYAEALFGPNHATYSSSPTAAGQDEHGVTSEGVLGLDYGSGRFFRWRVVEVSFGSFSGIPDSKPYSISTGVVFRFP
jgi:hypothetical protein